MRLFEAIIEANHRALGGDVKAGLHPEDFRDSLPVAALTCIDARLNPLIPEVLGIDERDFIWLRNAGNIITGPLSSTMRSMALACAVKGGKEIAVIGHTDCLISKTDMMHLTDKLRALGVDRSRLPENLIEYFGLFASERSNVIKACDTIRNSPLIGPKIPVHGLMLDLASGKLEWVVNGYQAPVTAAASEMHVQATIGGKEVVDTELNVGNLAPFHIGEMKFPEIKIGDLALKIETTTPKTPELPLTSETTPGTAATPSIGSLWKHINESLKYRVIGGDRKQYGPISGTQLLKWLSEDRINAETPVQVEGTSIWQTLAALAESMKPRGTGNPPPLPPPTKPKPALRRAKY